ncbi:MAG: tRNA 2-thiocytidine biosynthesis TtcA family protein [Armatimonadota bacterium]
MSPKWRDDTEKQLFFLSKKVDKAIREHALIESGDRILVGLSGGKDSLCLLRILNWRLKYSPVKYEVAAAHIKGNALGPTSEVAEELIRWLENEGVELRVRDIILPEHEPLPMNCERCSRHRKRTLFEIASELGCNKVALGHNLEDFAQTALMNLFSSGRLQTMAFKQVYFGGVVTVIRPLGYVREHDLVRLATIGRLPVQNNLCPLASTSKRAAARRIMHIVSKEFKHCAENILRAALENPPVGEQ